MGISSLTYLRFEKYWKLTEKSTKTVEKSEFEKIIKKDIFSLLYFQLKYQPIASYLLIKRHFKTRM